MYENYQETIAQNYIDEDDVLTILSQKLDESNLLKNTIIYIDEFSGFTKQEYEIIRKLLKQAKQVNITICTDNLNKSEDLSDIFYPNKQMIQELMKIAKEEKVEIEEPVYQCEAKRFKNEELICLEKNMSSNQTIKHEKDTQNIEIFLAQNPFSEINYIATEIIQLVKEKGYRYQDISVVTKNVEQYASMIAAVFAKYDISVFIDQKDFSQNVLVKYVMALLEIFAKNWSYESMFNYIKTGFCNVTNEEIFKLENYCISYGIKGSKWYKEDWKIAKSDEELDKLNEIRKRVVEPLIAFHKRLNRTKTVKDISKTIYEFLLENQIDIKLEKRWKI